MSSEWDAAIAADPLNEVLRGVYADYLDEQGLSDEADRQRKFVAAYTWLLPFVRMQHLGYSHSDYFDPDDDWWADENVKELNPGVDRYFYWDTAAERDRRKAEDATRNAPVQEIPFQDVMAKLHEWAEILSSEDNYIYFRGVDTPDKLCSQEGIETCCRHVETVTGIKVERKDDSWRKGQKRTPFTCSC